MRDLLDFIIRWIAICLCLVMIHSVPMNTKVHPKRNDSPVCSTLNCLETGRVYKENMNPRANPCIDFYQYTCGNWLAHHPKPESVNAWTAYSLVQQKTDANIKAILESKMRSNRPMIEKAKALYKACVDLAVVDTFKKNSIKNVVEKIGNWPMFLPVNKELPADLPWWTIDDEYTKLTGESAFLTFNTVLESKEHQRIILELNRPFSPYGALTLNDDWKNPAKQKKHYKDFLKMVILKVAPRPTMPPANVLDRDLENVLEFREELRKIIKAAPMDEGDIISVGQFQDWYNRISKAPQSKISWLRKISSAYKDSKDAYGVPVTTATFIKVYDQDYFLMLAKVLAKASKRTIANHIHIYFAERNVKADESMLVELKSSIVSDPPDNDKIRSKFERSRWCIANNELRLVLSEMYAKTYFTRAQKAEVEHLVSEAKMIISAQIAGSNWLDPLTKDMTIRKIRRIDAVVGYPDFRSPIGQEQLKFMNPMEVQAFYEPTPHTMFISAAYLQLPFYSEGLPYVIDYGSTVTTISHELYHAVDLLGLQSDEHGNTPWWPERMITQYKSQALCYAKQYVRYRANEMKRLKMPVHNGLPSTLNEDIADSMGLKVAYRGFKQKQSKEGFCPVVPGFEKFGCERLFFIAFANIFCAGIAAGTDKILLEQDPHSLAQIRINGAVANMPEFSAAFGCKPTDPLNLHRRCDIWTR